MKKSIALLLLAAMMLTLCACGKKTETAPAPAPAESAAPEAAAEADRTAEIEEAAALFAAGDYAQAVEKLSELQTADSPLVASLLGRAYYQGLGVKTDYNRAVGYLQDAAAGGVASARYLLAEAARTGNGLRRDPDEAARSYIKFVAVADEVGSDDPDYAHAMAALADCFAGGRGVEKKFDLALDAANKAAACEDLTPFELMQLAKFFDGPMPNAVSNAADATGEYAVETVRKIDAAKADSLYARAAAGILNLADAGNLAAIKLLGDLYLDGKGGLAQDYAMAMETYRIAADQDYAPAQAQLGYMYQNALGTDADYAAAMEWNSRAAEQGDPQGQAQIGYLYQFGLGVTQNLDEAGRWYTRAKEGGSEWAAAMLEQTEATNPHASFEAHA